MKKQTVFMAAVLAAVALATGCGAKKSEVKTDYVDDLSKYVTLGEYKGLEYEETSTEVTDEDVTGGGGSPAGIQGGCGEDHGRHRCGWRYSEH